MYYVSVVDGGLEPLTLILQSGDTTSIQRSDVTLRPGGKQLQIFRRKEFVKDKKCNPMTVISRLTNSEFETGRTGFNSYILRLPDSVTLEEFSMKFMESLHDANFVVMHQGQFIDTTKGQRKTADGSTSFTMHLYFLDRTLGALLASFMLTENQCVFQKISVSGHKVESQRFRVVVTVYFESAARRDEALSKEWSTPFGENVYASIKFPTEDNPRPSREPLGGSTSAPARAAMALTLNDDEQVDREQGPPSTGAQRHAARKRDQPEPHAPGPRRTLHPPKSPWLSVPDVTSEAQAAAIPSNDGVT